MPALLKVWSCDVCLRAGLCLELQGPWLWPLWCVHVPPCVSWAPPAGRRGHVLWVVTWVLLGLGFGHALLVQSLVPWHGSCPAPCTHIPICPPLPFLPAVSSCPRASGCWGCGRTPDLGRWLRLPQDAGGGRSCRAAVCSRAELRCVRRGMATLTQGFSRTQGGQP